MNKNTTIGMVLIFAVLVLFSYLNKPSQDEIEQQKHRRDSIALVEQQMAHEAELQQQAAATNNTDSEAAVIAKTEAVNNEMKNLYGDFSVAATGTEEYYVLENNLLRITISNKGGNIHSVELKNYKRYDSTALMLIEDEHSTHNLTFFAQNRSIQTDDLFFTPSVSERNVVVTGPEVPVGKEGRIKFNEENPGESKEVAFRLNAGSGRYIDYVYTIHYNSYKVDFDIRTHGMEKLVNTNTGYLTMNFDFDVPRQEHTSKYGEDRYTSMYYKFKDDEVDHLSLSKSDDKELNTPVKWIGYKQLFFSTILMADNELANASISTDKKDINSSYITTFYSEIGLPFGNSTDANYEMAFYFGPNHYQTLKEQGYNLEKIINLGWPIVREINRYVIIPVFNFLRSRIASFGLIILILTIMIRLVVFPFTYKSYTSQAKMRVLKPEIDEINKKYTEDKAMERQQATMALYKKVGVNPMGGCLPMLFQMPILIAMFYFFPGSIELRQQSFLWATDLSTYDSILSWSANIPLLSSLYGNHVSLFTLLMTATSILSQKFTGQTQDTSAMPGMKYMMYFMPIMFLFFLNSYSAGLTYYYFLANVFTIGQTLIIRKFIDEDKIRAQLMANKKKPAKKKSGFQQRLEEMSKKQEAMRKK